MKSKHGYKKHSISEFDLVIEGKIKGQNSFALNYEGYKSGDIIDLAFLNGDEICLYKKDVKKLISYLKSKYKIMK